MSRGASRTILFGRRIPDTVGELLGEPSALVVWDMQEHARHAVGFKGIANRTTSLIAAARRTGRPIIYTQHFGLPLHAEDRVALRRAWRRAGRPDPTALQARYLPGSAEWQFAPETAPTVDDVVIAKTRPNGFIGTPLRAVLAARAIDVIVLTGVATDKGILATAREAAQSGIFPVVVKDAVGTDSVAAQEQGLLQLAEAADLCTTAEVLASWGDRSDPRASAVTD